MSSNMGQQLKGFITEHFTKVTRKCLEEFKILQYDKRFAHFSKKDKTLLVEILR